MSKGRKAPSSSIPTPVGETIPVTHPTPIAIQTTIEYYCRPKNLLLLLQIMGEYHFHHLPFRLDGHEQLLQLLYEHAWQVVHWWSPVLSTHRHTHLYPGVSGQGIFICCCQLEGKSPYLQHHQHYHPHELTTFVWKLHQKCSCLHMCERWGVSR